MKKESDIGISLSSVTTATGTGTTLTVVPKVIVEKSTKSQDDGTTVKTTPLPTVFHTISSEEQNTTEVICMDKFDSRMVTIQPVLKVIQGEEGTSYSTEPSAQDPEEQRVNMLSMAVLGLRVLLAKSIAFNALMSIKLFLS
ncbi:uncharacterized protein LOC119696482 isoform X2 [Motacilla alba alba]|uniref:uncharacterized protein LOC119696482 isoform X2 n=1 Tax=Motacilla alba alba TaxID=1094192 RepID=UPI0018D52AB1|nr:uncharacterized protein LOC119696482 isoform X2 [Motacilla alba alba]XP_037982140.1 uncharacterized protein LOC119696482 isoform X2 [Motacilla alba alba]